LESSRKALVPKELLAPARFVADSPLEGDGFDLSVYGKIAKIQAIMPFFLLDSGDKIGDKTHYRNRGVERWRDQQATCICNRKMGVGGRVS
jgi:hypothetical protein